jgi:aminoglycoside phosphotransferase
VLLLTRMRSMWMMQLNTQPAVRVVTRLRRMGHRVTRNSDAHDMRMLLQAARPMIQPLPGVPAPATWQIQHVLNTVNDVRVALIGPARQEPVALLKMANTPQASESLQHRLRVGDILWNDPRLAEWRQVLPAVLANGHAGGHDFVVKQRLPGVDLRQLANAPRAFAEGQWAATGSITDLHQLTGRRLHADEDHVGRWVHAPALVLRQFSQAHLQGGQYTRTVDRLAGNLNDALLGRAFWVSRIHGDFAPGNIMVAQDGARVTGLVDWEMSVEDDLPQLDVMQLLLSSRMLLRRREMGDVVLGLLNNEDWSSHEWSLLEHSFTTLGNRELSTRDLVLMCWLRQVTDTLQKSTRYTTSMIWSVKNIEQVLVKL